MRNLGAMCLKVINNLIKVSLANGNKEIIGGENFFPAILRGAAEL